MRTIREKASCMYSTVNFQAVSFPNRRNLPMNVEFPEGILTRVKSEVVGITIYYTGCLYHINNRNSTAMY